MGQCKLCGKEVGWLRSTHKECEHAFAAGKKLVESLVVDSVRIGVNRETIEDRVSDFANGFHLDLDGVKPILLAAWDKAAEDVKYYESKTKTHFVGGQQGVSIRVMKGVYYRVGGFRGEPVQTTAMVHVDTGLLVVTNKHLTFVGPHKSVRLKHGKIISHTPYSDGIAVCRDAVTAKPQVFITDDGWFTYNVIVNAARQ